MFIIFQDWILIGNIIILFVYILIFALCVWVAGSLFQKENDRRGFGTAFAMSLITILLIYFVITPALIPIWWIRLIIIFVMLWILFALFYGLSAGASLAAAIICVVVLWLISLVIGLILNAMSIVFQPLLSI